LNVEVPDRMPFYDARGERIWYETYGDPAGVPVLALHGFTGNHSTWEVLAASDLARRLYLVAPDLFGHGWSAVPEDLERYRLASMARDLWGLWDHLGLGSMALVGYSMGGRLAIDMAVAAPERVSRLVLESATAGLAEKEARDERQRQDQALADRIERDGVEAFVDYWEQLPLFQSQLRLDADVREQVRRDRCSQSPRGLAQSLRGSGTGAQPSRWHALPGLSMPALIVVGEEDEKYRHLGAELVKSLPVARLATVAGAGHTVHLEQPEAFLALLEAFLAL
jgi:2-succinyl-6-hydroxy-2,4-cyclohexadiene-1-carboxylate synthase